MRGDAHGHEIWSDHFGWCRKNSRSENAFVIFLNTCLVFMFQDESHSIKTLSAQRTKAALNLITKAARCVLLSGTPALSRPVELYAQMKAVDPKIPSL